MYDKKTEELITGHKGTDKDISKILCKGVIGVRLNGKRGKMSTAIDIKSLGLTNYSEVDKFVSSNIRNTVINFFDKDVIKKFDNLINKVRQNMYNYSITNDGNTYYMTEGNFLKFKEKFDVTYKVEFDKIKNDLIGSLSTYKKSFADDLKVFIDSRELDASESKILYKSILNRFPEAASIQSDCEISYYVVPFPVYNAENVDGLNPVIISQIEKDKDTAAIDTFYDMVGNNLQETFKLVYKGMQLVNDEASLGNVPMEYNIPSKTKGFINSTIIKLVEDNTVLKNEKLRKIIAITSRTFREKENADGEAITNGEAMEVSEQLLGLIYKYGTYLGVEGKFSEIIATTEFTEEELSSIGDIANIDAI